MTGSPYGDASGDAGAASGGLADGQRRNPYLGKGSDRAEPDLDTDVHDLRSDAARRLNRKALVFLAGIVLLAATAGVWTFGLVSTRNAPARPARAATVVIPAMPDLAPAPQAPVQPPQPVPLATVTLPPLPPLPDELPAHMDPHGLPVQSEAAPPSLRQRRTGAGSGPMEASPGGQAVEAHGDTQAHFLQGGDAPAEASRLQARVIADPDTLLLRGTYIRCLLQSRIVTDVPGFTACVVTEPVYSINARRVLLPRGSRVLGRYSGEPSGPRVAVVWDRIVTPTGVDISMSSPGVDGLGSAGHPGDYDAHWGSRIASALLISVISDGFKYAAADQGPRSTTVGNGFVVQDPYESATARTMERLANDAVDRGGRRPATVTINQGELLNVYVARDVDFSRVLQQ